MSKIDLNLNFTKQAIEKIPIPTDKKYLFYKDTKVNGLALAIQQSGYKSFYVYKKINGKPEKILLGKFPDLTIENARTLAMQKLGEIALGINPQDQLRKARNELTFGSLYEQYLNRYSKVHKKSWRYDEREIPKYLFHWFDRKLPDIKKAEIVHLRDRIFEVNGKYQANRIVERIRAMYNKAIEWGYEGINPTAGIKKFKEKSRDRFIQPNEMPFILRAIEVEENLTAKSFIQILLLTGTRKTNTLMMRWEQINWHTCEWRIPDTKNGDPLTVAISQRAISILEELYKESKSAWVFPQEGKPDKHMVNEKRVWKRIKEKATIYAWLQNPKIQDWLQAIVNKLPTYYNSGTGYDTIVERAALENISLPPNFLDIRLHDIRRTFGSYQAISGASLQIIGKSLGHKSVQSTQVYARLNLDAVRSSIEKATDVMYNP